MTIIVHGGTSFVHGGTSFSSSFDDFLTFRLEIRQIWEQSLNRPVWENLLFFSESSVACNQDWSRMTP